MPLSAATMDWLDWMLTTSIPLRQVDAAGNVVGRATGALIEYSGHRFLLSAEHAVPRGSSGWAIQLRFESGKGTEMYWPRDFIYVAEFRRSTSSIRELDLCVAEVAPDLQPLYEYRTPRGLFDQRPVHIFAPDLSASADADEVFAFSGQVRAEQHGPNVFAADMVVYPGLKLVDTQNEVLSFKLPVPHPGHDAFHGCSGAPIVDRQRRPVALVVGGDESTHVVRGIALQRCLPALQFLCSSGDA